MSPTQGSNSGSSARHMCHCGKSFARKEHLTRHQSTHKQPAYVCNLCHRRFTRKELLRRHSVLHDPKRTRVVISCDACRANKTKCSGGTPCSLCARRGLDCVFRDDQGQLKGALTSSASKAVGASVTENSNVEPILPDSSMPENALASNSLPSERTPPDHGWLQDLLIVPSRPVVSNDLQDLSSGIGAIHELLLAEKPSLEAATQASDELQVWITKCVETYFKRFHLRWPILNAPSFDVTTEPLTLAASVCMIGMWLGDEVEPSERLRVLQVHEILLQRLLHKLIDLESMPDGQAWPLELLQATFLTLAFSLYRIDKSATSRAMLLRSTFITVLREKGMFNAKVLADHLRANFTGTYAPYTVSMRERFKRLLALTYQLDVYFALAHEKPPILHRREIGVDLTTTFALWNAYGLDIFVKRMPDEPMDRVGSLISAMTDSPSSFASSQLLVEDVILGLCGTLQAIWVLKPSSPSGTTGDHNESFRRVLLMETLDAWKHELDKIEKLASVRAITGDTAKHLWLAYRGEDESTTAISERITTLVQDGMVIYYYLKLFLCMGAIIPESTEPAKQIKSPSKKARQTIEDERRSVVCALQILEMSESARTVAASMNPLNRHALIQSMKSIRALLSGEKCNCLNKEQQRAPETDFQKWTEIGGLLCVDGTPFCVCQLEFWTGKFRKAIQDLTPTIQAAVCS